MDITSLEIFDRELRRLPPEHKRMFLKVLYRDFIPAANAGAFSGTPRWPSRLRIHKLAGRDVYSLTWSFASPDGRATFDLQKDDAGNQFIVLRRIGDHSIYKAP